MDNSGFYIGLKVFKMKWDKVLDIRAVSYF